MKKLVGLLVFCLGAAAAPAGELETLIETARAAPGEFAADALIRLAGSEQVDRAVKIQLLEQAFERASQAQHAYPRHLAPLQLGGAAPYWNRPYRQGLDALSLRLRAIEAVLPIDGGKAKEWFASMPPVELPRLKCEEFLVYDVARLYEVLGKITKLDPEPQGLLRKYASSATSPVQLAPMAVVLASAKVKDSEFQALVESFATAMGKVAGDDRSFTFSTGIGKAVLSLVEECKRRSITPLPLLEAYRLYLVVNYSGIRCADNDRLQSGQPSFSAFNTQPPEEGPIDFAGFFNEKLRMAPLAPIQELETTPSRLEGVVSAPQSCLDDECQAFARQLRGLILGTNGAPLPPAERNTAEWQNKLKERIAALAAWKESKGTGAAGHFREKSQAFGELVNLAHNGPGRELVLAAWLDFLKQNPFQKTSRMEWLLPVNALIGRVTLDPAGLGKFAEVLRKVDDPVIALYANVEAVAPRRPDQILSLF